MGEALFALAGASVLVFLLLTFPIILFVNKAIAASWEEEAKAIKAELEAAGTVLYAEDGVRVRKTAIGPFSMGRMWLSADLRGDQHSLWVFPYQIWFFGKLRVAQPAIRVVAARDVSGPGVIARMREHPIFDGPHVVIPCDMRLGSLTLRLTVGDPRALMAVLHRILG